MDSVFTKEGFIEFIKNSLETYNEAKFYKIFPSTKYWEIEGFSINQKPLTEVKEQDDTCFIPIILDLSIIELVCIKDLDSILEIVNQIQEIKLTDGDRDYIESMKQNLLEEYERTGKYPIISNGKFESNKNQEKLESLKKWLMDMHEQEVFNEDPMVLGFIKKWGQNTSEELHRKIPETINVLDDMKKDLVEYEIGFERPIEILVKPSFMEFYEAENEAIYKIKYDKGNGIIYINEIKLHQLKNGFLKCFFEYFYETNESKTLNEVKDQITKSDGYESNTEYKSLMKGLGFSQFLKNAFWEGGDNDPIILKKQIKLSNIDSKGRESFLAELSKLTANKKTT